MNKVKGVLAIVLVFSMSIPCWGSTIKRKKNKWNHSLEQKVSDNDNLEILDTTRAL